jgi:hypothetical protein
MAEPINLAPKWEYMSESAVSMDRMNELGAEGWELAFYNAYFDREDFEMKNIAIFKRVRYEQLDVQNPPMDTEARKEFEDKVWGFVQNIIFIYGNRLAINEALLGRQKTLTLAQAKDYSKMYGHITTDRLKEALTDGRIKGTVPEKREIEVSGGCGTGKYTRQYCIGSYEFDVKSLTEWLEKVGIRRVGLPEVTECLDRILSKQ